MITWNNLIALVKLSAHQSVRACERKTEKKKMICANTRAVNYYFRRFFFVASSFCWWLSCAYAKYDTQCCMKIRSTSERGVQNWRRRRRRPPSSNHRLVSLLVDANFFLLCSSTRLPACPNDACGAKSFWFQVIIRVFSRFSMNRKFHLALNNNWPTHRFVFFNLLPLLRPIRFFSSIVLLFSLYKWIFRCAAAIYSFNYALSTRPLE